VNTSIDELWNAWLAEEGVKSFLAPVEVQILDRPLRLE